MVTIIAVVGGKKSGKTTTIELLTRELTKRGYRVAAVKHIPEPNFTIDREGKDTWRFARSGAKTVVGVSAEEIATIEKRSSDNLSLNDILSRSKDNDIVFLEGFKGLVEKNPRIQKIVVLKSPQDAEIFTKEFKPILAFTGPCSKEKLKLKIPFVDVLNETGKLADIVERVLKKD